jgi:hypothetical protein
MPVNMDPKRKRKPQPEPAGPEPSRKQPAAVNPQDPNAPTEADLAEKEWKNLWEATEVIDMDKW